jgi:hypothetical protein
MEKRFCMRCEQRLPNPQGMFMGFLNKVQQVHEFKEGFYCEKCAKVKVEEGRK